MGSHSQVNASMRSRWAEAGSVGIGVVGVIEEEVAICTEDVCVFVGEERSAILPGKVLTLCHMSEDAVTTG